MKYNLTLSQNILLPFIWIAWKCADTDKRKPTWHLVKKGIEKHVCFFNGETIYHKGYIFQKCSHEGCNMVNPL